MGPILLHNIITKTNETLNNCWTKVTEVMYNLFHYAVFKELVEV